MPNCSIYNSCIHTCLKENWRRIPLPTLMLHPREIFHFAHHPLQTFQILFNIWCREVGKYFSNWYNGKYRHSLDLKMPKSSLFHMYSKFGRSFKVKILNYITFASKKVVSVITRKLRKFWFLFIWIYLDVILDNGKFYWFWEIIIN